MYNLKDIPRNKFGVYALVFPTHPSIYIGSTSVSFKNRLGHHIHDLKYKRHHSTHVQRLWDKHGDFEFCILEECIDKSVVIEREQWHIDHTNPEELINFGPAEPAPFFGKHHSAETRAKISAANTGTKKPWSKKLAEQMSHTNKGRVPCNKGMHHTQESKDKINAWWTPERRIEHSKKLTGKTFTPEYRHNLSIASRNSPKTQAVVAKMCAANTGKKRSLETRQKIAAANKGKILSPETRAKISEARHNMPEEVERLIKFNKERVFTPETKLKLSIAAKARHPKRYSNGRFSKTNG